MIAMTFWGWVLAIPLCLALLGFIIQMAEYVFDFDFDDWCRKQSTTRQAKATKDAARSTPQPDKEPAKESTKEPKNGFFNIHISGNVTIHTHDSHQ